jgi:uncharacterized protein YjiS (DUF1127 family)
MSLTLSREALAVHSTGSSRIRRPGLLIRLFSAIAREIRIRRDMRMLASLDEAALHDIGLARGGVEDVVRHGRPRRNRLPASGQAPTPVSSADYPIVPNACTEWR